MKTIEIDDDIHVYLLRNVHVIGEDASSILRRLLGLPAQTKTQLAPTQIAQKLVESNERINDCILNPRFRAERDAVGKFLLILSWLHKKHARDFSKVLNLRGRTRDYFAQSAQLLETRGNSVNPQKIPDTNYWVITNNDTPKKQRIIQDAMHLLGYTNVEAYRLSSEIT